MEQKVNGLLALMVSVALCFSSLGVFADTNCPVTPIKKGDPAPCDGFYFNRDAENQAEQARSDADFYDKLAQAQANKSAILEDENTILQKRLNLYIQESKDLSQAKAKSQVTEDLIRIGCFSLGTILTVLIVRNVRN